MIRLKVTYFLTAQGHSFFPAWYEKVRLEASEQEGYLSIEYHEKERTFIVSLAFQSESLLDQWREKESHEELVQSIAQYFREDPHVEETSDLL